MQRIQTFVFDKNTTAILSGIGCLLIVLCHVGYFIFEDKTILQPFSNYGGIAVNLFFLLSAFGLSMSTSTNASTFYWKRFKRIIPAVWISLALFLLLDFAVHSVAYEVGYVFKSFLLWFQRADLFKDINSPLWYITPLVIYYLAFPVLYRKQRPFLSAILFLAFGYFLSKSSFVVSLFKLHYIAFPTGILLATYAKNIEHIGQKLIAYIHPFFSRVAIPLLLLVSIWYFGNHTDVGGPYEQYLSMLTVLLITALILMRPFKLTYLVALGGISFEIYLLHWPLMFRFDVFKTLIQYPILWLSLWIVSLILLATLLKKVCNLIEK